MDVFVSHISEEAGVAKVIKDWIDSTYLGQFEIFVSSDSDSIPAGTKWLDEITKAIIKSKIILLLCSQNSIHRPWINFEAGCGWSQEIPVIPICYAGLKREDLPPPISALQALNFDQYLPEELFKALNKHLGVKRLPRINYPEMYSELEAKINKIGIEVSDSNSVETLHSSKDNELNEEQINILTCLAKTNGGLTLPSIAHHTGLNQQRAEFYLEKLETEEYIYAAYNMIDDTKYSLVHKGRELLFEIGVI